MPTIISLADAKRFDRLVPFEPELPGELTTWADIANIKSYRPSVLIGGIERSILKAGYSFTWESPDDTKREWEIDVYTPSGWMGRGGMIEGPDKLAAALDALRWVADSSDSDQVEKPLDTSKLDAMIKLSGTLSSGSSQDYTWYQDQFQLTHIVLTEFRNLLTTYHDSLNDEK